MPAGTHTARWGGTTVMAKSIIVGVGALMFFQDPDGNVFGAMQFDKTAE